MVITRQGSALVEIDDRTPIRVVLPVDQQFGTQPIQGTKADPLYITESSPIYIKSCENVGALSPVYSFCQ